MSIFLQGIVGCQLHNHFCQTDQIVFGVKSPHQSAEARPSILLEFIREIAGKSHVHELAFQEHRAVLTLHRNGKQNSPDCFWHAHAYWLHSDSWFESSSGDNMKCTKHIGCWDFPLQLFFFGIPNVFIWAEQLVNLSPYHLSSKIKSVSMAMAKEI